MSTLHLVQGGIDNGDKAWLERAAPKRLRSRSWVVPKSVWIGDDVVIYVSGYGFFATARVASPARPRKDWPNRYGSALTNIKLIDPPISLGAIQRGVPQLAWAKYPRSIATPAPATADRIRALIQRRRRTRLPDLEEGAIAEASIHELRRVALLSATSGVQAKPAKTLYRIRSQAIRLYVLCRADGHCEGCSQPAPFVTAEGTPYLEPHHTRRLADDGPDHPARVIALCPNCHSRAHHADDATRFNRSLVKKLDGLESKRRAV